MCLYNLAFTKLLKLRPCNTTVVGWQVTQSSLMVYRLLVKRNLKERKDLGIDGRIILWLMKVVSFLHSSM